VERRRAPRLRKTPRVGAAREDRPEPPQLWVRHGEGLADAPDDRAVLDDAPVFSLWVVGEASRAKQQNHHRIRTARACRPASVIRTRIIVISRLAAPSL